MKSTAHAAAFAATLGMLLLGADSVAAQDANHQAAVEDAHQRYEQAIADRDYQAIANMYAEDAVHLPADGGILEGRDQIRQYFDESQFTSLDIHGQRVDAVGENIVIDIGTFAAVLPEEAGGGELEGEYVVVAEIGADGLVIHHLAAFPPRQLPEAPGQQ